MIFETLYYGLKVASFRTIYMHMLRVVEEKPFVDVTFEISNLNFFSCTECFLLFLLVQHLPIFFKS